MAATIFPVVLAGGAGTRLWPMSRQQYPKQFLGLMSDQSILQETVLRANRGFAPPILVTGSDYRFLVAEQLRQIRVQPAEIILEPVARNTAPAIAVAALIVAETDPGAVLLVMPSDHAIRDTAAFARAIETAAQAAEAGKLVTFGITPGGPKTGYGYIRQASPMAGVDGAFGIERFVEKPEAAVAEKMLAEGGWLWNSGIFAFRADRYLEELERFEPAMMAACREVVAKRERDLDFSRLDEAAFSAAPSISIDYAVMERTEDAVVVPVDMGWSDLGSWPTLWEEGDRDGNENVVVGDAIVENVNRSYVRSDGMLVAVSGVDDVIVVATKDAVLVADRGEVDRVKGLVEQMKAADRYEYKTHLEVHRPWGSYQTVDAGDRFQVKRITVKPGAKLSLQMHHHRAEHWVVVSGTALVTRGQETILLRENESTFIPLGVEHRLENPGKLTLHLIEVQSGAYLGEDDIVRFDDQYGRTGTNT
ncbi:MAG: mannose-1-phosphate guanylyltransferase/mannose-6-phosphate isomerase [Rhodospirillaceae bacterium]|nr:mannose-1-phosphate guanylyltransferase/mannose-6-phosphate isomerase [Rhodospirillaceae bacterium]